MTRCFARNCGQIRAATTGTREWVSCYRDRGRLDVFFSKDDRMDRERWDGIPALTRSEGAGERKGALCRNRAAGLRRRRPRPHLRLDQQRLSAMLILR
jgi:hypothetical protein